MGRVTHDFYPVFVNHLDKATKLPIYMPIDTIAGVSPIATFSTGSCDRLSGLDLYRFCYVASEPSTGMLFYADGVDGLKLRPKIYPGGTLTPRAWYTRVYDNYSRRFCRSRTVCDLTLRPPRLLNPLGERWVYDKSYRYQIGRYDRTLPHSLDYIPGHRVHPPTPDAIRADRKYYWENDWPYRDNRPAVKHTVSKRSGEVPSRDRIHPPGSAMNPRPCNPWQFLLPQEAHLAPAGPITNPPKNPVGVRYWDANFPNAVQSLGLDPTDLPSWVPGEKRGPRRFPRTRNYVNMGMGVLGS